MTLSFGRKTLTAFAAGAILAATALTGTFSTAQAEDPTKVGFVYVGPISDHGWSTQHDRGRQYLENELGDAVETSFVATVPESEVERVISQMVATGHDLIFTTSFGYMNPTLAVANRSPNTKFEHVTGYKTAENMSNYSARFYEGRYISGTLAGRMTETNTIGYIATYAIPTVIRGINSAYLAAKAVNPDVEFKIIWVNTWYDPGKEADAAKALIDQGADVILQHTDSPAPGQVAQERGVYAVGQASDQTQFAPEALLTSIIDNWGPYYVQRTLDVKNGTWESQAYFEGFADDILQLAPFHPDIPAEVVAEVEGLRDAMAAGTFHPFTGPINNQAGELIVPAGETIDPGILAGMDFYVEGITAQMP